MNNKITEEEKMLAPEFLEEMKRIREQRGISIEEVAEKTNIKLSYIRAIENGDMSRLPGGIYNRAFIRSISEFLGIDTRPFEKKVESDEMIKEKQVRIELGRPQNASMPSKLTIIGCLFVIFFLYSIFYGPRVSKKEQVQDAVENYKQEQTEIAQKKIETAKTPEDQDAINAELQAKVSDESALIKKIPEVSPIKKETEDLVSKELVITLMAKGNVKVIVKDFYGKVLTEKEMVASEAIMLNGSEQYSMTTDNINNLDIYLDGVQIKDIKKIERDGKSYIFKADKLVSVAESQPIAKHIPDTSKIQPQAEQKPEPQKTDVQPAAAGATISIPDIDADKGQTQSKPSADKTQKNPQGTNR